MAQHVFALFAVLCGLGLGWDGEMTAVLDTVPLGCLQRRLRDQPAPIPDAPANIELFGDG